MLQPHPNLKNGHCLLKGFAPIRNLSAGEYGEAAQCALVSTVYDGCHAMPDDPDWVVSKLLNEVNGSAEDFFRACQAELYWTQQIHPENLLVSFKVVGMLSAFFFPGAQYDGTVDKEVESFHQSLDGKQPAVTPGGVSPVSVVIPPTELTTITRKRRSRDKHKSNKKKGKSELPVGDGATIFFNCEKD